MSSNRLRILSEVLALDAWHDPFTTEQGEAAVYVELSFQEGRVGGSDDEVPFTFKISLKRALLKIQVERPLKIERKSIARSVPEQTGELTRIIQAKVDAEAKLAGKASISPKALSFSLGGEGKKSVSREDELKLVQTVPPIIVQPHPIDQQCYAWELTSSYHPVLKGQPWHPINSPRLCVYTDKNLSRLLPSVKVSVSCALEDVVISDLQLKQTGIASTLKHMVFDDVNYAAAIHHLKKILTWADLAPRALDNRFCDLLIGEIMAAES